MDASVSMIVCALTCTGPYAILIMLGIKRTENRNVMPVPAKGRCAIGCSKSFCKEEFGRFVQWASENLSAEDFERLPSWGDVKDWPGKIVGVCDYAARTQTATGESWNEGYPYWWDLSGVESFDLPIPCRGNVGVLQLPLSLSEQVTAADLQERSVGAVIATAEDAARVFRAAIPIAGKNEGFFVLPLDADRRALAALILVSLGEASTTMVDPSGFFSAALQVGAKAIAVAHNHPSGNASPSEHDKIITESLQHVLAHLNIKLLEHLIISSDAYYSFMSKKKTKYKSLTKSTHSCDNVRNER